MQGAPAPPVWVSPILESQFKRHILLPLTKPQVYHPELLPIPWCTAVIGRKGLDKCLSVEELLKRHGIRSYQILENAENCQTLLEDVQAIFDQVHNMWINMPGKPYAPIHVLVIDNADRLCFEPDNEATAKVALKLAESAKEAHCLLIAICDRLPNPGLYSATTLPPYGGQRMLTQFYNQFHVLLYAPCPDGAFRITYFKWLAERFSTHLRESAGRKLSLAMDDEQFRLFADHSGHATQLNIYQWMQKLFYALISEPTQVLLDWDYIASPGAGFISHRTGVPHISDTDLTALEGEYSTSLGMGPLLKPTAAAPAPQEKPIVTTGFTKKAAHLDTAVEMLESRSKLDEEMDEFKVATSPIKIKRERPEDPEQTSPKTPPPPEASPARVQEPAAPVKKPRGRKPGVGSEGVPSASSRKGSATKRKKTAGGAADE